jgi:hypothetical protein
MLSFYGYVHNIDKTNKRKIATVYSELSQLFYMFFYFFEAPLLKYIENSYV